MNRIAVTDDQGEHVGWFDADAATRWDAAREWDGSNHIDVNTRSQWSHQALYRTAGARWVLHHWSNWQGSLPSYEFVSGRDAHMWLIANREGEAADRYFGQVGEAGPGEARPWAGLPPGLGERFAALAAVRPDWERVVCEALDALTVGSN